MSSEPAAPLTVAGHVRLLTAPNPGPMTLDGTNTWIVGDPDQGAPLVIDPGPLDDGHLRSVLEACGGRIAAILLTHRHHDHADGAGELASMGSCRVRAADPRLDTTDRPLVDGDEFRVPGATVRVHATPGHTGDSVSLLVRGGNTACRLLTGDTVLGRGTTVITRPDGNLGDYLRSLELLESLVRDQGVTEILPGHGPRVSDPAAWLAFYRTHRLERLQQVREALAAGDRTPAEVVARVYADVDRSVWPAAEESVAAQLEYLGTTSGERRRRRTHDRSV